ncbi:MAG: hypothetical protein ACRD1T_07040 [Acidimicrobiia bacterium]
MVLSIAQLPPEYRAVVWEVENGALTLDKAVESFYDPEGLRAQLVEYGWESGYQAGYQAPEGDDKPSGPSIVLSTVEVFETSDGAAAKLKGPTPTDGSGSPPRTLSPSDAARFADRFHRFVVDLGDEAGGFRIETKLTQEDDSDVLSSAFITFRRGRLIGQVSVAAYNLSDKEAKELEEIAKDLASKMNHQMSAVLARHASGTAGPMGELANDSRHLTLT